MSETLPGSTRDTLGALLHAAGLVVLPLAVYHGLRGGSFYEELLLFGFGMGLLITGRGLRAPRRLPPGAP